MNYLINIDRSLPSLSQGQLISILLYGSDAFDNKKNHEILICTIQLKTHTDLTIPFSKSSLLCQILLIQYPNVFFLKVCVSNMTIIVQEPGIYILNSFLFINLYFMSPCLTLRMSGRALLNVFQLFLFLLKCSYEYIYMFTMPRQWSPCYLALPMFFSLIHHTVVIRCSTSVSYGTLCHASGHLVIYHECYGFQREFFTSRCFLPCTPFCFFKASLGPSVQPQS